MTIRFRINYEGPNNEFGMLYPQPETSEEKVDLKPGYIVKIANDGETQDWINVKNYLNKNDVSPREGWVPTWVVGEPIGDLPQSLTALSLTYAAARQEMDMTTKGDLVVSSEYLIALFMIENDLDTTTPDLDEQTSFAIKEGRPNKDAISAYGITSAEWAEFMTAEGEALGWQGDFVRALPLTQLRCAAYLTQRDWRDFAIASGGTQTEPFLPRKLDLFMSRIVGTKAAVEIANLEESKKAAFNGSVMKVIRSANQWVANSPDEKALVENRKRFLKPGGTVVDVKTFVDLCRQALDAGLKIGYDMLNAYLPGFVVQPSGLAQGGYNVARTEFDAWKAGGWKENSDPGQSKALGYFEATDHGPGAVTDASGEITHWCGAFVAHCMKVAGAPVPSGSAAAASWKKWGDVSYPASHGSDVPEGAVVLMSRSGSTNPIGHVCFFKAWSAPGKFIHLGGNQSDAVTEAESRVEKIVDIRGMADKSSATDNDLLVLAKTLYGEIRGGTDDQIRNVANVILNRFLTNYRSKGSIAGACLSPSQFSCWNPGTSSRATLDALPGSGDATLDKLKGIAEAVIANRLAQGPSDLPLTTRHYHTMAVNPNWADSSKIVKINGAGNDGAHIFYRDIP